MPRNEYIYANSFILYFTDEIFESGHNLQRQQKQSS